MIYAEDYTRWDAANRLCFDPERAYTAAKSPCKGESFPAEQALSNMALWNAVVNAYSTRQDRRDSFMWGHDGFLATFGRFHEVTADKGPMLAEAARMAERSGVMSMEIMFSVYPKDIKSMAETAASAVGKGDFEGAYRQLETADFPPAGSACIRLIESNEKLRCNGNWSAEVSSGGAHRTP